ncbi:glucosylceramidase [Ranunculus cassubicifolius]
MRLGVRLWSYVREEASKGRKAPIDPFTRESCKPSASQGVPLGGMRSGSISRGFRREFRQLQIIPGLNEPSSILANQFSIFISRDHGNKKFASVLAPGVHEDSRKSDSQGISSWGWNLSGQHSTYHALFPRAWTIYDGEPDPELKISCRQISPFIPHNYRESSLPVSVFVYTLQVAMMTKAAKVMMMLTLLNFICKQCSLLFVFSCELNLMGEHIHRCVGLWVIGIKIPCNYKCGASGIMRVRRDLLSRVSY